MENAPLDGDVEIPVKEIPVKEIPVKEIPVKEIPVKEIPVKEVPVIEIVVNGDPRTIQNDATVAALLGELGMATRHVAVEVNEELIPRERHADQVLGPGDRLEIVTLVGGG